MAAAALPRGTLVRLRGVVKDYASEAGLVHALREVDLTIERGEFVAIVGTSGSGKSTLMNILGCLDRPTRGTYELAGLDVGDRSNDGRALVRNRLIGFIFQGFNLLPRTTALENCELPLFYRGVATAERRERALLALGIVGLADRVHHTPNQLSGGQQQRVAIARALVSEPELLLADEPTGNLDTRTSFEVLSVLQRLNRERGITIVLVTHEPDIAACASRVIWVKDGIIEKDERHTPRDAAAELSAMAPADVALAGSGLLRGEAEHTTLPPRTTLVSVLTALVGAGAGLAYDKIALGEVGPVMPMVFALVAGAFFAVRHVKRAQGAPPRGEQRSQLAFRVALAWLVSFGVLGVVWGPKRVALFGKTLEVAALTGGALSAFLAGLLAFAAALLVSHMVLIRAFASLLATRSSVRRGA